MNFEFRQRKIKPSIIALSICIGLVLGTVFVLLGGYNVLEVYSYLIRGSLGSVSALSSTIRWTTAFLLCGIASGIAFKGGMFNMGTEGQLYMGAISATLVGIYCKGLPAIAHIPLCMLAGMVAGAIWASIPALLRVYWNTSEIVVTLMMNYIATQLVAFFTIVWEVPKGSGKIGIINQDSKLGWLPQIFGSKYLLSIIVAVIITIFMYIYLKYSKQGYEITVVGESENTAKYVGIKVGKVIIRTMVLSGAICGLVGLLLVGGINHTVTTTIAGGQGFTAVLVSWMSKFNPLTMVFSSFLIIFMDRGASEISTNFGLNHSYADILTGIILFFIIGCEFFITYKLQFRKKTEKEAE